MFRNHNIGTSEWKTLRSLSNISKDNSILLKYEENILKKIKDPILIEFERLENLTAIDPYPLHRMTNKISNHVLEKIDTFKMSALDKFTVDYLKKNLDLREENTF